MGLGRGTIENWKQFDEVEIPRVEGVDVLPKLLP